MDVNNDHLLRVIARSGKPVVLSTGLSTLSEIDHAVTTLETQSAKSIIILHCVSLYPTPDHLANLRNMDLLRDAYGLPVGFSDHTSGYDIALAAIARGATFLEKHFTLDKAADGWDHAVSADPEEMGAIVRGARRIAESLGQRRRVISDEELKHAKVFRRSVVAARDIAVGETISDDDLTYKRPGTGISPNMAELLLGMKAVKSIPRDSIISLDQLSAGSE